MTALVAMLILSVSAFAQVSVGVGYLHNNKGLSDDKGEGLTQVISMHGLFLGVDYNYNIIKGLSFLAGVNYQFLTGLKDELQEHTLEFPLNLRYNYRFNKWVKGFIFTGPALSVGLASTMDSENNYATKRLKRFNLFLEAGLGVELIDKVNLTLGYGWGCLNKAHKNRVHDSHLKLGVAYLF